MQFEKQANKKRFAITCSLILSLLSFNLSAVIYKITELSDTGVSFYFQSQVKNNYQTVYLDEGLLLRSGFQAEQTTIEPDGTETPLIYRVSGGPSLSQQTDTSASSPELTRNLLPAFRIISSTLRHPEFRQALSPEPEQHHREMRIFYHINEQNINLMSDMNEVSRTANNLQTRGMISDWFPQLPYLKNEREIVIPVTVYRDDPPPECSSEATSSGCSSGQRFLHKDSILGAFGVAVGNQPAPLTLSERNPSIPPSPKFDTIDQQIESQLHIATNARVSNRYTEAMNEERLSYHDPSLSKVLFLREDADDGSSTWLPPQHFIVQAEFDSTDDEDITVPDPIKLNALYIGNTLDNWFPEYIWIYRYTGTQRISSQRVVASFMFDYYSTGGTTINLQDLQLRSIDNSDDQSARYRFIHWQPMRINTVTPTQLAEEESARRTSTDFTQVLPNFRRIVRSLARTLTNLRNRNNHEQGTPMLDIEPGNNPEHHILGSPSSFRGGSN